LGHYTLFSRGILHRDVSVGNILRYSQAVQRPALEIFECTKDVNYCQGFLIDGDHAIEWRKFWAQCSLGRCLGTLPFMSVRLLSRNGTGQPIIQTAIDDLESFSWILVWVIVHVLKGIKRQRLITQKSRFTSQVLGRSVISGGERRSTTVVAGCCLWGARQRVVAYFPRCRHKSCLVRTGSCIHEAGREREKSCDELESYSKTVYEAVLESGFRHLEKSGGSLPGMRW
ncbi:hypothetical protein BJV77DRAFT_941948, partial [Russula vinacea]